MGRHPKRIRRAAGVTGPAALPANTAWLPLGEPTILGPHLQHDFLGVLVLQLSRDRRQLAVKDGHCTSGATKSLRINAPGAPLTQHSVATCSTYHIATTRCPPPLTRLNWVADGPVVQRAVKRVHVVAVDVEADLAARTHLRSQASAAGGSEGATAAGAALASRRACHTAGLCSASLHSIHTACMAPISHTRQPRAVAVACCPPPAAAACTWAPHPCRSP